MSFEKINLIKPIHKALSEEGYKVPTPIQKKAIPVVLEGKDLLGCAQTGTGKTAAFAVPILQLLSAEDKSNKKKGDIHALIVTPTRELAIQIGESFDTYGKYTGLKNAVVFGGVSQKAQTDKLQRGIDILIATPGRLLDLINQKFISLNQIKLFVLDEADRMLDMGFINDVNKIIALLPKKRQSLFFSATMPPDIIKLANTILSNPVKIEVTPESPTVDLIDQSLYFVAKADKKKLLTHLLKNPKIISALVFTRTKHGADSVVRFLKKADIKAEAIHGDKAQNARQRALSNFKSGEIRVLVATDIAARGIDIDELSHVINFDIPNIPETYVHRIGRTGRAGLGGIAISLCDQEERAYIKDINKLIRKHIPIVKNHPFVFDELTVIDTPKESPVKRTTHRKGISPKRSGENKFEGSKPKSKQQNPNQQNPNQQNPMQQNPREKSEKNVARKGYLHNENPPSEKPQRDRTGRGGSGKGGLVKGGFGRVSAKNDRVQYGGVYREGSSSGHSGSKSDRVEGGGVYREGDSSRKNVPGKYNPESSRSSLDNSRGNSRKTNDTFRDSSRRENSGKSGSKNDRLENSGSRGEVSNNDRSNKRSGSSRSKFSQKKKSSPRVWTNR
jgi:ATP-dependent RNA helicase RhlE